MEIIAKWWQGQWVRLLVAALASAYFIYYALTYAEWHFIDYINLIFHEAGHWIFLPFGEFMHILGGSLFQTIFPLVYVIYFYLRRDHFSASLLLFWVGQNLLNVSVYAADAMAMQLPLLGGESVIHDWNYILGSLHIIQYTPQIASCIYGAGIMMICFSAISSVYTSQERLPQMN